MSPQKMESEILCYFLIVQVKLDKMLLKNFTEKKTKYFIFTVRFEKTIKTAGLENLSNRCLIKSLHQSPHLDEILRISITIEDLSLVDHYMGRQTPTIWVACSSNYIAGTIFAEFKGQISRELGRSSV